MLPSIALLSAFTRQCWPMNFYITRCARCPALGAVRTLALSVALFVLGLHPNGRAESSIAGAESFIDEHCSGCHNDVDKAGRLDLSSLTFDPNNRSNLQTWVKVFDRLKAGEMPPKRKPRPD